MNLGPAFAGVILAAGSSTRMGRDKALLPWPADSKTKTFLSGAIDALQATTDIVLVVGGENAPALETVIYSKAAYLLQNPDPSRGMTSSLRIGLRAVLDHGRDAAVVMLVDRPPVEIATIEALKSAVGGSTKEGPWAAAPEHDGQHGHPLVVRREMIEVILRSREETTAREVLASHQDRLRSVTIEDTNAFLNVNTPDEYAKAAHLPSGEVSH